jgi:parallel beta-helix repeat protein
MLYVDNQNPGCSNTGAGTATQPFCTISAAAAKATAGTTVQVAAGTYTEQVSVKSGASGSPVVFQAAPGATVTVTGGTYGFYISNKSWVTVTGFTVTKTTSDGFHVSSGSNNIQLIGNDVSYAGQPVSGKTAKGIAVSDGSNVLVQDNTVEHNSNYGIYLTSSSAVTVTGNNVSFNAKEFERAASGIRLYQSSNNVVSSNVSHDNEDSGIEIYTSSTNNLVVDNVSYNNGDHGIDIFSSPGQRVISNTIYMNVTAGINAEGGSTGTTYENNISVDSGINSPRTKGTLRVDAQSTSGTQIDYDLLNVPSGNVLIDWGGVLYGSLASFVTATGQEKHGIHADPKWVAPASGNFQLSPGSAGIDSADSGASGETDADAIGAARIDDPGTPNTGAGPRQYDDRGAYEMQPGDAAPAAQLAVTPGSGTAPLTVSADASGSTDADATPIATYTFDFGDGTTTGPQTDPTATHTYGGAGSYRVTVTVTDTSGLSGTASYVVQVSDAPPTAALTVSPSAGTGPLAVTADASSSTDLDNTPIATYSFDFGDGTPVVDQAGPTAAHTYDAVGAATTYTVKVVVTDTAGLTSTATTQVTVNPDGGQDLPPSAALTVSPTSGTAPLNVTADASASSDGDSTPIATYTFDFGDGSALVGPQAGATAAHTYNTAGTYTVTVTVTDSAGNSSSSSTQVTVKTPDLPPSVALTVSPTSGPAPLDVVASAAATDTDDTPVATYKFDFGDGTVIGPQSGATAAHTYTATGTYTVTVTVADTAGKTSTATSQVTVLRNLVGNPGFETDLSGWNTSGGGANITLTRVSGGHTGNWSAQLKNTGTTASTTLLNDSPNWVSATAVGTYTAAMWVRADTAGATLTLRLREWSGPTLVGTATSSIKLTTAWQKVSVAYTPASAGSSNLDLNAYVTSAAAGTGFYADDVSIFRT